MSETPGEQLEEEPQDERGAQGSRDEGEGPGGGPVDRPAGTADEDEDTGIDPQSTEHPESPDLASGGN